MCVYTDIAPRARSRKTPFTITRKQSFSAAHAPKIMPGGGSAKGFMQGPRRDGGSGPFTSSRGDFSVSGVSAHAGLETGKRQTKHTIQQKKQQTILSCVNKETLLPLTQPPTPTYFNFNFNFKLYAFKKFQCPLTSKD